MRPKKQKAVPSSSEANLLRFLLMLYMRVTISEEEKFLTNSVATFRDNKQALYGSFQYVLNTTKTQLTKYCKS